MTMGVAGVLSRIQELQGQLGLAPLNPDAVASGTVINRPTGANGSTFASALADAGGARTTSVSGGVSGGDVVASAKKSLGTPYVFGSTDPDQGLDCSALVQRAYGDLGIQLPRNSAQQAKAGQAVDNLAQARPGDILAFDSPVDHVAIYLGDNKMIAAPKAGDHVKIQTVYEQPTHIRRVVPDTAAAAGPSTAAVRPASLRG